MRRVHVQGPLQVGLALALSLSLTLTLALALTLTLSPSSNASPNPNPNPNLYRPEFRGGEGGGGFHLLDQYGEPGPTTAAKHGERKAEVWSHLQAVLARGGSVEGRTPDHA